MLKEKIILLFAEKTTAEGQEKPAEDDEEYFSSGSDGEYSQ